MIVLAVNGEPVKSAEQVSQFIRDLKDTITLRVDRAGASGHHGHRAGTRRKREKDWASRLMKIPFQRVGLMGAGAAFA